jgi:hypothetical protein
MSIIKELFRGYIAVRGIRELKKSIMYERNMEGDTLYQLAKDSKHFWIINKEDGSKEIKTSPSYQIATTKVIQLERFYSMLDAILKEI